MCVLKPAVYQKAKSHWLHLSHFPPCVLSNASSKLLHLRIHNYALQRFHSVKPIQLVDDWNKNNREYGVFTMRWNLPSGYIITLAALYVSSALGRWEAIVINSNIHHRSQVLKRLQLLPSHHFIATIDIWASIVLATYGVKNMKGGLGWGDFNMINRSQISKKGLFRRRNLFLRVWKSDTKLLGKWENGLGKWLILLGKWTILLGKWSKLLGKWSKIVGEMKQNCWGNDTSCWGSEAICVGEMPQIQSAALPAQAPPATSATTPTLSSRMTLPPPPRAPRTHLPPPPRAQGEASSASQDTSCIPTLNSVSCDCPLCDRVK